MYGRSFESAFPIEVLSAVPTVGVRLLPQISHQEIHVCYCRRAMLEGFNGLETALQLFVETLCQVDRAWQAWHTVIHHEVVPVSLKEVDRLVLLFA